MLLLKDALFQWQQREALSPHRKLSTIATLLIHWLYVHVLTNLDAHPTSMFGKIIRHNLVASRVVHIIKWESVGFLDNYYEVGVTAIPYPRFKVIINIISKEDIVYCVTIGDIHHCTCHDFTKMPSQALGKERKWVYYKHLYYVCWFYVQGGLRQWQVHLHSNIHLQRGHAATWTC